ncbi:hypothetical protein JH06_3564 [Blastocystis sp. subtype 4]|uniref:hypothetical protein n=1 Tax=Blastocystis sp. subtype 4 TaxID=944170 RepID=UPI00071153D3|nr:hypothetical protein JH06_3564 [Blastocystis sp. subtype 4]KNB42744.1 hypothetical protein JH06_3564 [Blastocystis sp. subtype 4]|eukprot:XP_014526187.1 hypothetical protein JH06_3564 [Blastocystis sp. subtype 4]
MSQPQFDSRAVLHQLDHQAADVQRQMNSLSEQIKQKVAAGDRAGMVALAKRYKSLQEQLGRIQKQASMCSGMNSMIENARSTINKMLLETQKKLTEQMKMINEYTYLDYVESCGIEKCQCGLGERIAQSEHKKSI